MISYLPDNSYEAHNALPLADVIMPAQPEDAPDSEPPMEQAKVIQEIKQRRVFTWQNIAIGLSLILIASIVYFAWPESKLGPGITKTTSALLDISKVPVIAHPNESGTGSTQSQERSSSSRNERPHKNSRPIPKGEGSSFATTNIGNNDPPGDDEGDSEEEDENRRRRNQLNSDGIYSDAEEESEEYESDDEILEDEDSEEMNWMLPPATEGLPLVGEAAP